jgi:hypothetical protein
MYRNSTTAGCASNTKFFPTSKPSASQFRMTLRPESSTHPSFPHILHWWECLSGDDPSVVGAPSSSLLRSKICVGATIIQNGRTNVLPGNSTLCGARLHMQGFIDLEMVSQPLTFLVSTNFVYLSFIVSPPFHCQACIQLPCPVAALLPTVMRQDISTHQSGGVKGNLYTHKTNINVDCLIVGTGFGGVYLIHHLRKAGYSCTIFEAGSDLGGIWH